MLTTADIARRLGVSPRRVLAIAASRGVEPTARIGKAAIWRPGDIKRLTPGKPGRPFTRAADAD